MKARPPIRTFYRYFPVSDRDLKWGFHVTTAGESTIPPHTPYPPPGHPAGYTFDWAHGRTLDALTLIYISGGRGWFESQISGRQRVESGSAILIDRDIWHRYRPDPETGWQEYWVGFDGVIPRQWIAQGFFSARHPVIKVSREDLLLDVFTGILEAIRSNQPALQQVIAGATGHILALLYSSRHSRGTGTPDVAEAIHRAIHLMNTRTGTPIDLQKLAAELHVSYTWFRRSFLHHTGLSPYQYLLQLRVAKARRLLSETRLTIQQVSDQSGFESEQYFCRLFKHKTGLTPGRWRTSSRSNSPLSGAEPEA